MGELDKTVQEAETLQQPMNVDQDQENEKRRLVIFYKRVAFEGVERFWIYFKRLGRVVNFEATSIPYIIRRMVFYYTISGCDLDLVETALKDALTQVRGAQEELKMCEQI